MHATEEFVGVDSLKPSTLAFGMALAAHDTAVDRLALAKTKGLLPC